MLSMFRLKKATYWLHYNQGKRAYITFLLKILEIPQYFLRT